MSHPERCGACSVSQFSCLLLLHHRTSQRDDEISLSLAAGAVAFFANWAGARMKLDYSAKLFIMTFLLVTFGAQQDSESSSSS